MRCAAVAKQLLRHAPPWRHRERARKVVVVWTRGDNSVENRPLVGSRRIRFDRGDRRCVCDVQRSSVVSTTHTRCHLEQRLVFAIRICSHQLHQELGIRMLRGTGILDRSISVYDLAAQTARSHRRITQSSHGNPLDGSLGATNKRRRVGVKARREPFEFRQIAEAKKQSWPATCL